LRHAFSAGVNETDDIIARRIGYWRNAGIHSVAHQHVGVGYSRSQNPDAQLIRARIVDLVFDYLEDLRPTESAQDHAGISHFEQLRIQNCGDPR
jgi:hypothetical protein